MRRDLPSLHIATPRWTKPVPLGGCPASYACGSYAHSSRPVLPSSATTRLYDVLRNSVSPIANGVAWKLPGLVRRSALGVSPVAHPHAGASCVTFSRLIVVSDENLVAPGSPPYTGQLAPACARAEAASTAPASQAPHRQAHRHG